MVDKQTTKLRVVIEDEPQQPETFLRDDSKRRSILKSALRTYEADPVRLTPGLDTSNISVSPISEPVFNQINPRIRFASTDDVFHVSDDDQIIRRGIDHLHFILPLNSPLLRNSDLHGNDNEGVSSLFNRSLQTPPLTTAQTLSAAPMNSPYTRMCDQLESFVDAEIATTDTILFNRPLEMRNLSVDLSPELERASSLNLTPPSSNISSSNNNNNNNNNNNTAPLPTIESRSLWLGNVDPTITEEEIRSVFESFGPIENVRLLPAKECAFVNFYEMENAIKARSVMQGKPLGNMILRIGFGKIADNPRDFSSTAATMQNNFIESAGQQPRSVWIGNLSSEITADLLMLHFNVFGPIESCRVLESKNCAFVNFYSAEAAATAKTKMNGAQIGNTLIKTGNAKDNTNNSNTNNISDPPIIKTSYSKAPPAVTFASIASSSINNQTMIEEQPMDGSQLREFRKLIEWSPEEIPAVIDELISCGDLKELCVDGYGNILLQKIIERAQEAEKLLILEHIKKGIAEIAKHKNGTWVIQKIITSAALPNSKAQAQVIEELRDETIDLLEDQFGNYVIQCILTSLTGDDEAVRGIVERIIQNSRKLAIGKYSSRALKSILDASHVDRQKLISQALAKEAVLLSVDPNGAVVIQWILDSNLPGKIGMITGQLQGRLAQVALTKQGSVIVARIIGSSDEPSYREAAILELYDLDTNSSNTTIDGFKTTNWLDSLLAEPSTCSILFKAFQVSKPAIRIRLSEKLKPKLLKLLKEITGESNEKVLAALQPAQRDQIIPVHLMKLYQELISESK